LIFSHQKEPVHQAAAGRDHVEGKKAAPRSSGHPPGCLVGFMVGASTTMLAALDDPLFIQTSPGPETVRAVVVVRAEVAAAGASSSPNSFGSAASARLDNRSQQSRALSSTLRLFEADRLSSEGRPSG
jgi:hypothetical protein